MQRHVAQVPQPGSRMAHDALHAESGPCAQNLQSVHGWSWSSHVDGADLRCDALQSLHQGACDEANPTACCKFPNAHAAEQYSSQSEGVVSAHIDSPDGAPNKI